MNLFPTSSYKNHIHTCFHMLNPRQTRLLLRHQKDPKENHKNRKRERVQLPPPCHQSLHQRRCGLLRRLLHVLLRKRNPGRLCPPLLRPSLRPRAHALLHAAHALLAKSGVSIIFASEGLSKRARTG